MYWSELIKQQQRRIADKVVLYVRILIIILWNSNNIKQNFCFRYRTNWPSIHEDTLGLSKNNPDGFQKL